MIARKIAKWMVSTCSRISAPLIAGISLYLYHQRCKNNTLFNIFSKSRVSCAPNGISITITPLVEPEVLDFEPLYELDKDRYKKYVLDHRVEELPKTSSIYMFENANHDKILLVGTIHFTQRSRKIVKQVIERVRPDLVTMELDKRRYKVLVSSNFKRTNEFYIFLTFINAFVMGQAEVILSELVPGNMKIASAGLLFPSGPCEFDVATIETKKLPFASFHLVDQISKAQSIMDSKFEELYVDLRNFNKYMEGRMTSLSPQDWFEKERFEKITENNYEIFMSEKSLREISKYCSKFTHTRNQVMSENILHLVEERRKLLDEKNILTPLWCVSIVGGAHVIGMSEIFEQNGFRRVETHNF